ncbi:MAG: 30S ribosomal protein S4 [Alphaproteobacteria bacterium]|nr:MAG: 30S ribosomal protein S4 [Alphaproteobacteria bacterium]
MSKRIEAKHKIDRRLRVNLWGRAKSPINKRNARPGQHSAKPHKASEYGIQLMAKQKLKGYYGNLNERQFRNTYERAARAKGDTGENLISFLEHRLDAFVYRAKWSPTVFSARQIVNHGHITVNGQRVNIPSYRLRLGDVVELRDTMRTNVVVLTAQQSPERDIPDYIDVDAKSFTGKFTRDPLLDDVPYPVQMEPNLIIEFYSR